MAMNGSERPTSIAHLDAGPVEYRLEPRGEASVVVLHGGHNRAGLALGEEVFAEHGYTVLAPSRPGYGRTPLRTGRTPAGFADAVRELCGRLDIDRVTAVMGVSAGGRTAVTLAARHPAFVERLILESALSFHPWPDRRTRIAARVAFNGVTERATWAMVRALLRANPTRGLHLLLGDLSTKPADRVVAALSPDQRAALVGLFSQMRSGQGFLNDLHAAPDLTSDVCQPTLVIASRNDGAVDFAHAEALVAGIDRAELVVSQADSHLIWFSEDHPAIVDRIGHFLRA
ncbi:alpha/beta fold hydrolase [Actinopolymorpha alba]|uniref:alpha/beta fold hydrolase n=1 Tax=Actinopolymorpha alba TaxID=533267 RepID=UPI00039F3752|nr:alpha/beta hydrolase [Actinopolymorpha alba]